jgi:two-component system response regulator (stage 0 sporulation protein F)
MMRFFLGRLLIVEDDLNALTGLRELLGEDGFFVHGVVNGREAIEAAKHEPFDIVLCDYSLPGMDGLQVCRELKRLQPHLALFLVTAYRNLEVVNAARQCGIEKVIAKPLVIAELFDTLTAAVARLREKGQYHLAKKEGGVPAAISICA